MSKRSKNFGGVPSKRIKTENDLEDLWGDDLDLDESVIDDCFKLATQVIEEVNSKQFIWKCHNMPFVLEEHHMHTAE